MHSSWAAKCLTAQPTAIGAIPQSGFLRAIKLAPKNGPAGAGTPPFKTGLIKRSELANLIQLQIGLIMKTLLCFWQRPLGLYWAAWPAADT